MSETYKFEHFDVLLDENGKPQVLGEGGMGITYKARDTRLGKTVALKMIRSGIGDVEVAKARFAREARLAAQLHHPNVVPVHHFGEVDGQLFYAMEFCDGPTVEQWIESRIKAGLGPLPVETALTFCAQIASALAEAERLGLTHRDIKPSNIIVLRQADGEEAAKLIDFGLAKAVLAASGGTAQVSATQTRGFTGSYRFASPEQLREQEMDIRSDFYSLGATLWFMLFGQSPFPGESVALVITRVLRDPLPVADLDRLPPPVAHLLEKMLAKDGSERQQSAVALKTEIRECLQALKTSGTTQLAYHGQGNLKIRVNTKVGQEGSQSTVSGRVPISGETGRRPVAEWLARHKGAVAAGLVALALVATASAFTIRYIGRLIAAAGEPHKVAEVTPAQVPAKPASPPPAKPVETAAELHRQAKEILASNPDAAVDLLRRAASLGDPSAQFDLGDCYANGKLIARDWQEAIAWYTKSANAGFAPAQHILGRTYLQGIVAPRDYKVGYAWSRKAAEQGNAGGECNVGVCYENGWGVEMNPNEAVQWFIKSAEQGIPLAQDRLGSCYYNGKGVPQDYNKAVFWLSKAAETGLATAQFSLAYCYEYGKGVDQNLQKAFEWFLKAANSGHTWAENSVGYCYEYGKGVDVDNAKAFEWFQKSAAKGCSTAEANLGNFYFYGIVGQKDIQQAVALYQKAAAQGDALGEYDLGLCYYKGQGVEKDYAQALALFRKADSHGLMGAAVQIGICYAEGNGVAADMNEAVQWLQKAARSGSADAQKWLKARQKTW